MSKDLEKTEALIGKVKAELENITAKKTDILEKEKNALACSRAFDYVSSRSGEKELMLMMNCLGDAKHWSENVRALWKY